VIEGDNVVCLRPVNAPDAFVETAAQDVAEAVLRITGFRAKGTVKTFNKRFLWFVLARASEILREHLGAFK
jgi:hypothetical protein